MPLVLYIQSLMVAYRVVSQCQAAVAEAVEAFGRIDVLLCAASEGIHLNYISIASTNLCDL
jgi:NAD(P)-dependent dehydrogenase (short-subunit alcohol dehydrogenase family)